MLAAGAEEARGAFVLWPLRADPVGRSRPAFTARLDGRTAGNGTPVGNTWATRRHPERAMRHIEPPSILEISALFDSLDISADRRSGALHRLGPPFYHRSAYVAAPRLSFKPLRVDFSTPLLFCPTGRHWLGGCGFLSGALSPRQLSPASPYPWLHIDPICLKSSRHGQTSHIRLTPHDARQAAPSGISTRWNFEGTGSTPRSGAQTNAVVRRQRLQRTRIVVNNRAAVSRLCQLFSRHGWQA